jgi:hypothetical protein
MNFTNLCLRATKTCKINIANSVGFLSRTREVNTRQCGQISSTHDSTSHSLLPSLYSFADSFGLYGGEECRIVSICMPTYLVLRGFKDTQYGHA